MVEMAEREATSCDRGITGSEEISNGLKGVRVRVCVSVRVLVWLRAYPSVSVFACEVYVFTCMCLYMCSRVCVCTRVCLCV